MNATTKRVVELLNKNNYDVKPAEDEDRVYYFTTGVVGYDDIRLGFLYMENDDPDVVTFCSPAIYEYQDDDFAAVINAMNDMAIHNNFVKPVIIHENSVWLYYDLKLFNRQVEIDIIHHMIETLGSFALNLLNKIDEYKNNLN